MTDNPLIKRLAVLNEARTLSSLYASATQSQPENHVYAVLHFIAIDLTCRFSLIEGVGNNG
jgi:hypothetical protein